MKLTSSRTLLGVASVTLVATAAACGDDDSSSRTTTAATAATAATVAPATSAPATSPAPVTSAAGSAAAGSAAVAIADSSLGKILVDGKGMTLYMFEPDNKGPSTCTGGCAAAWPAVGGPVTAGVGVDVSKLATAKRPDSGTDQATYGGWPLYTFAQDAKPGDVNGQDSGGVWYVVGADGSPIED